MMPPIEEISDGLLVEVVTGCHWHAAPIDSDAGPASGLRPRDPPSRRGHEREAVGRELLRRLAAAGRRSGLPVLRCSAEAYTAFGKRLARRAHERFVVVALDARNRPLSRHLVAQGSLTHCVVHPREVFGPLVRRRAAAAILLHNHPSGDVAPSPEDEQLTERLSEAGRLLGIPVLDHLIVGGGGYFSFRDAGRLGTQG